jgi:hypothetical protein
VRLNFSAWRCESLCSPFERKQAEFDIRTTHELHGQRRRGLP